MFTRKCIPGLAIICFGCRDIEGPSTGDILASVSTTSAFMDRDANGYVVQVGDREPYPVAINGIVPIGRLDQEASNPAWSRDGRKVAYTQLLCDDYGYYCDYNLAFVGVGGSDYTGAMPGRFHEAVWQP